MLETRCMRLQRALVLLVLIAMLGHAGCGRRSRLRQLLRVLEKKAGIYGGNPVAETAEFKRLVRLAKKDPNLVTAVALAGSPVSARVAGDALAASGTPRSVESLTALWFELDRRVGEVTRAVPSGEWPLLRTTEQCALGGACSKAAFWILEVHERAGSPIPMRVLARMLPQRRDGEDWAMVYGAICARAIMKNREVYLSNPAVADLLLGYARWRVLEPEREWQIAQLTLDAVGAIAGPEHLDDLRELRDAVPDRRKPEVDQVIKQVSARAPGSQD